MTSSAKRKGDKHELATVALFKEYHLDAKKVPLSGAADGFKGDIHVTVHWKPAPLKLECKIRAEGFKELYRWLEGNDAVVVRADRKPALAVIPLELFVKLCQ